MSIHKSVENMIKTHGSDVTITVDETVTHCRAFVQPLRYKLNGYQDRGLSLPGYSDKRYYLYIGQAGYEFSDTKNTIITCNGKKYVVHTSETFEFKNKGVYVWAVLKPYKEQRRDDYDTDTEQC